MILENLDFKIDRTIKLLVLGLIIGLILFFNSETLQAFILGTLSLGYAFGVIGFITENFTKYKSVLLIVILLIPPSIVGLHLTTDICTWAGNPGLEIKENSFTGEIKVNEFRGDRECSNLLPWYYEEVDRDQAEDKIKSYCSNNNESKVCGLRVKDALRLAGYR